MREKNGKWLTGKLQRTSCEMDKHDLSTHIYIKKERRKIRRKKKDEQYSED